MSKLTLFSCSGGEIILPAAASLLIGREDGGNLVVNPPRPVWERSALGVDELRAFSFLVAAAGEAMLRVLPQLQGGCINYWEAGNWALNDAAEPQGKKVAPEHRRMHLHLLGRSRFSENPNTAWGESPVFPRFADRLDWARSFVRLGPEEAGGIVRETEALLRSKFAFADAEIAPWSVCPDCSYPSARGSCAGCA